jgi:hypothetical protein
MIVRAVVIIVIITIASFTVLSQTSGSGPDAAVRAFYAYSNARSSTFNRRHIELRKKWYTQDLYTALVKQLEEDQAHLKTHPTDKPYFGDGLDFRPLDEPCEVGDRSYKRTQSIVRTEVIRSRAEVDVKFAYPATCTSGGEPIVYTVNLRKMAGKWLIDDWSYPDGSTLVGDMKSHTYSK